MINTSPIEARPSPKAIVATRRATDLVRNMSLKAAACSSGRVLLCDGGELVQVNRPGAFAIRTFEFDSFAGHENLQSNGVGDDNSSS